MSKPSPSVEKALFAKSGNRCAFQNCSVVLVDDNGYNIGEIGHITANNPGGPRYDATLTDKERNASSNLLVLCSNHHTLIDSDVETYSVDVLQQMKIEAERNQARKSALGKPSHLRIVADNSAVIVNSPGAIQNNTLNVRTTQKRIQISAPSGTIGANADAKSYVKHLIDLYNEFTKSEPSREREFSFGAIYTNIKSKFGCQWELVSLSRFEELCDYLKQRISRSRIGRNRAARGQSNYSSFDGYVEKYRK
jgi:hypothetical protein